ncbi:MAG: response regulator [Saprospiraceae bacterium]|nr:response regulator [Saprospiraceae bacterium]
MESIQVLIVEDELIIAADIQARLNDMGYITLGPIRSGEKVLEFLMKESLPDIIIMDIMLEGKLDGIETAKQIGLAHKIPIIFLTGNEDELTFTRAKTVDPQAFLSKPFKSTDLQHAIELAIKNSSEGFSPTTDSMSEENTYLLSDRVFIKMKNKMIRLFLNEILWVEADDYYCKIHTKDKEILVGETLKKFYKVLSDMPQWMRIHRSYIVNLNHIEEIDISHVLINNVKVPINKASRDELLDGLVKL